MTPQEKYDMLRRAVEMFLERPGCNSSQKALALKKLIWALEQTKK